MQSRRLMIKLSDCNCPIFKDELKKHFNAGRMKLPGCGRFAAFLFCLTVQHCASASPLQRPAQTVN